MTTSTPSPSPSLSCRLIAALSWLYTQVNSLSDDGGTGWWCIVGIAVSSFFPFVGLCVGPHWPWYHALLAAPVCIIAIFAVLVGSIEGIAWICRAIRRGWERLGYWLAARTAVCEAAKGGQS